MIYTPHAKSGILARNIGAVIIITTEIPRLVGALAVARVQESVQHVRL